MWSDLRLLRTQTQQMLRSSQCMALSRFPFMGEKKISKTSVQGPTLETVLSYRRHHQWFLCPLLAGVGLSPLPLPGPQSTAVLWAGELQRSENILPEILLLGFLSFIGSPGPSFRFAEVVASASTLCGWEFISVKRAWFRALGLSPFTLCPLLVAPLLSGSPTFTFHTSCSVWLPQQKAVVSFTIPSLLLSNFLGPRGDGAWGGSTVLGLMVTAPWISPQRCANQECAERSGNSKSISRRRARDYVIKLSRRWRAATGSQAEWPGSGGNGSQH